ncbi:MAG: amidase [Hyphomonas sp.]|nr:amidase [Hyphomonas sp.]
MAKRVKSGEVSPVALAELMLARIAGLDGQLNSYQTVMAEQAMAAARAAEDAIGAGTYLGPLHGIPIAVKDLFFTAGVVTKSGVAARSGFVPDHDATVVQKLKQAGAIILGKLNLTEGALNGYHPDFRIPVNPWNADYSTSGSSSGSGVATAAGLCFASLGTDTGGSIRNPSSASGVVGLKPTYGRVSRQGVFVLAESLDHVGPMTRYVTDAAIMFEAMAGHDPQDTTSLADPVPSLTTALDGNIAGMKVGFDPQYALDGVNSDIAAALESALDMFRASGAEIVDMEMPAFGLDEFMMWVEICAYEAVRAHRDTYPSQADSYGASFGGFLEFGLGVTDELFARRLVQMRAYGQAVELALTSVDGLVCPSGHEPGLASNDTGYGGLVIPSDEAVAATFRFAFPVNFAGIPSLTVPAGFTDAGAPFGMQIIGKRLNEPELVRLGFAFEQAAGLSGRHPDLGL